MKAHFPMVLDGFLDLLDAGSWPGCPRRTHTRTLHASRAGPREKRVSRRMIALK